MSHTELIFLNIRYQIDPIFKIFLTTTKQKVYRMRKLGTLWKNTPCKIHFVKMHFVKIHFVKIHFPRCLEYTLKMEVWKVMRVFRRYNEMIRHSYFFYWPYFFNQKCLSEGFLSHASCFTSIGEFTSKSILCPTQTNRLTDLRLAKLFFAIASFFHSWLAVSTPYILLWTL